MPRYRDWRDFPVGTKPEYVQIPVDGLGRPIETSVAWRVMMANAIARPPEQRSPAERAAIHRVTTRSTP